ncbi:cytochrome b5, putative [Cordyceps militaris CM01]|uniref:Cytochrome b5, putative n=1 Tax=Cordyceps militaris (strain CM01) TaxID=983644 RepID=G3JG14_CORMM|nr:cytochrome b5, putative [Cordyceps militaris CM01]EGX93632.1 cytochrome b5, putative [Cordyceps militaris CM01]
MSQSYAAAEVSKHKDKDNGLWLIIEGNVYDVTSKYIIAYATTSERKREAGAGSRARALLFSQASAPPATSATDQFVDEHPGGARVIQRMGGKDATKAFWKYHGESVLAKYGDRFKIGTVAESAKL